MTEIHLGGAAWLITQAALLVAFYGGFAPLLPWWVVWFPTLFVIGVIGIVIVVFVVVIILAAVFS